MMLQDTRILVTVQIIDDNDSLMFLFSLATIIFERLHRAILTVKYELDLMSEAINITGKIIVIALKSLAFGLKL